MEVVKGTMCISGARGMCAVPLVASPLVEWRYRVLRVLESE